MKKEKTDQRKPESRLFQVKPVRLLALEKQLRKVANYISNLGEIILDNNDPTTINAYQNALLEYSELLKPWSKTLANEMNQKAAQARIAGRQLSIDQSQTSGDTNTQTNEITLYYNGSGSAQDAKAFAKQLNDSLNQQTNMRNFIGRRY